MRSLPENRIDALCNREGILEVEEGGFFTRHRATTRLYDIAKLARVRAGTLYIAISLHLTH